MTGRTVQIVDKEDVSMYVVRYLDRAKGGWYYAGQFDKRDSTREDVESWCKERGLRVIGWVVTTSARNP